MNQLVNNKIKLSPEYVEMHGLDSDEMYLTTFESLPKEVKRKIKLSLRRQILDEMKKESEWSNLLRCKVREWKKDPERYSSTHDGVFNTEMSPEKFYDVFVTPEMVKSMEEEMEKELVGSSPLNRPPSKSGILFKTRMKYGFMIVCGVSDSNFFPITVIDDSDGLENKIGYCLLKDRGNITFVLAKHHEKLLNVNEWSTLISDIEKDSFNEFKLKNKRFSEIIKRVKKTLSKYKTYNERTKNYFSLKEILGKKVWDVSSNIEVHIQSNDPKKAKLLLPKGALFELANKITKDYVGNSIQFRLVIETDFQHLGAAQLAKNDCQLGANSFLAVQNNKSKSNPTKLSFKG